MNERTRLDTRPPRETHDDVQRRDLLDWARNMPRRNEKRALILGTETRNPLEAQGCRKGAALRPSSAALVSESCGGATRRRFGTTRRNDARARRAFELVRSSDPRSHRRDRTGSPRV